MILASSMVATALRQKRRVTQTQQDHSKAAQAGAPPMHRHCSEVFATIRNAAAWMLLLPLLPGATDLGKRLRLRDFALLDS